MVLSRQWSSREQALSEKHASNGASRYKDVRVAFKASMFSMLTHFAGIHGRQAKVFGIHHPTEGGTHMIVLPSCLRLDPAHGTIVLDCIVVPLFRSIMPALLPFLAELGGGKICNIKVDNKELALWKKTLPSFVERCRTWEHLETCEYLLTGKIPLSTTYGEQTLCSCGHGKFPASMTPKPVYRSWDKAAGYFVRAAISPMFSVPLVEESSQPFVEAVRSPNAAPTCQKCAKFESPGGGKLLTCARCQVARYCSKECQKEDWAQHKILCRAGSAPDRS